ncbi:MAG: arylsulfatase [Planctomycetota bacterium]|jgi:arylsulfatase
MPHKTLIALITACFLAAPALSDDRPNIVLVMTDDMGFSDLGCYGGEIETPNIDALGYGGLRFTRFYSENMCWVSRSAMLTGIWHKAVQVDQGLSLRSATLAETLGAAGYTTMMSGKWHLGDEPPYTPPHRGFQRYYGFLEGTADYYQPDKLMRDNENVEHEYANDPDFYLTNTITDHAVQFIEEADEDKPLLLYLAYNAAHWPLHALEKDVEPYYGKYAMGWDKLREERLNRMKLMGVIDAATPLSPRHPDVPAWADEPNRLWQERRMEVYAAQITVMDRGVGRVVETLKKTGRYENTLIVFMYDNGGCHVEYAPDRTGNFLRKKTRDGRPIIPGNLPAVMPGPEDTFQSYGYGWANASNTPLRLFKQHDHEGGIRTPMIVHWPRGVGSGGALVRDVAHLIDITPTVLEATGTPVLKELRGEKPMAMDGKSLLPIIQGSTREPHEALYFSHSKGKAIRQGDWKLVRVSKNDWELYDLSVDENELNNLADQMPERRDAMEKMFKAWEKKQAGRNPDR